MRTLLPLLFLVGCGWDNLPNRQSMGFDEPLWDIAGVLSTAEGLYVPMPHNGGIALVPVEGEPQRVDIGEGRVIRTSLAPEGAPATLAAVIERYRCEVDDPKDARRIDWVFQCPSSDLQVDTELALISDGAVTSTIELQGPFTAMEWSPTGSHAVAWIDLASADEISGVVNLTSVVVIDAAAGSAVSVPVGFAATDVVFDASGARALVLSESAVAVVDLTTSPPTRDVTFALTLDPDQVVRPVGVSMTPDGQYAMISAQGKSDLYVLDLENHSVNIVSLDAAPSAMHVDPVEDRTVLVSASAAVVDVVDHDLFAVERVALDEPMSQVLDADGFDLLYGVNKRDVYRFDPLTGDVIEYRLQAPLLTLHLAPTGEYAIALTTAAFGGRPGMEVLDLRDDRGHAYPFLLEGVGLDVKFTTTDDGLLHALVLQAGVEYLYALDLYGGSARSIELSQPPVGIGALANGGFYVTHADALGLISVVDPSSDEVRELAGFGALGLLDDIGFVAPVGAGE